ncbi:PAS domain S-box-containing protein/diguanylate cyclase (GGDEF)-like protein [Fluviicoccus keumensis]|uniref:PAS domain S-box-containing protein/diguanylate cyclase (GGDEF)-like protein n=1 Tax=Fluviicoccus keumensis TaxID=1435465 RepID=A0A4Q7Z876_9GAMM|nr:EAL domain-containing protein [Fluviicoccus keumensis]RZU46707.1 PAS domain S-box-containing protein/diguanylate cyclase (GGDEF)-like protein [Fluviicoccus keumensis]
MAAKSETLRLLVLHNSADNTEEIVKALKNAGTPTRPQLVDNLEDFEDTLNSQPWDLVLAGEEVSGSSYSEALQTIRNRDKDIPLIVLLKAYDESMIVESLEAGAVDAIVFDQHQHVVFCIRREIKNLYHRRAQRTAEAFLKETEKRCQLLLENSRDAIAYVHDGMHIYANTSYVELFGYESGEDLEGMPVIDLVAKEDLSGFKDYLRAYGKGEKISTDLKFHGVRADGDKIDAMMQLSAASYDGEQCTQIVIRRDDGKAKAAMLAEQLKVVTSLDGLTGLPNRQRFEENLEEALIKVRREKSQSSLFFMSMDNVPQINAAAGIVGTDNVISSLAQLLKDLLNDGTLARFSDTAFTVILPETSADVAKATAEKLCQAVHERLFDIPGGKTIQTSLSIGIAMIGETAPDAPEILSRAVNAAEKVKLLTKGVGNGINLYNPAENAAANDSALRELLAEALEQSKFKLLFQPLFDVEDETAQFFEVFVRLPLADGKLMTPDEFMPVAQRYQLGSKIDRWVMINACKRLKEHLGRHPGSRMLINLTAESLQDPSLADLAGKLAKAIDPKGHPLVIQFSENDVVTYLKQAKEHSTLLKAAGCPLSITNFGCTVNPMNTLKHVDADYIKLDRSFTQDLSQPEHLDMTKKMAGDVNALNKRLIVSYVENANTVSKLWTMGVRYLQGYYLQPPSENLTYESQS